ncbi:MAG: hypothetical protein R3C68_18530 [Myxococcota bacterium]
MPRRCTQNATHWSRRWPRTSGAPLQELVGQSTRVCDINLARYVNDQVGEPTLRDIVAELQKPGRDPRQSFEAVRFRDDIHSLRICGKACSWRLLLPTSRPSELLWISEFIRTV